MRFRWITLGVLLLAGGLAFLYREAILATGGEYLIVEHPIEKADAIFVLAGAVPERILAAVDLYKGEFAPRIVLTKGEEPENLDLLRSFDVPFLEGHEQNLHIALRSGVPPSAITVLEARIDSTYSEIELIHDHCLKEKLHTVILVTSKSHTRRVQKIFNRANKDRIRAILHASRYDTFDGGSWWNSRRMAKEVLSEYQKLLHYYFIVMTGGNYSASPPRQR